MTTSHLCCQPHRLSGGPAWRGIDVLVLFVGEVYDGFVCVLQALARPYPNLVLPDSDIPEKEKINNFYRLCSLEREFEGYLT